MSEPYIRVYAADMRGDPKIDELGWADAYLLIQLWDLAKNGPGDQRDVIGPDGNPMPASMIGRLLGVSYQRVNAGVNRLLYLGLCERLDNGILRFSTLPRRQGLDPTNRLRQARFRDRRNGEVTAKVTRPRNAKVTGQNQNQNQKRVTTSVTLASEPEKPRPRNEQWDGLVAVFGYSPDGTEATLWGRLCVDLKRWGYNTAAIQTIASRAQQDMNGATLTPTSLHKHARRLMSPNWHPPVTRSNSPADRLLAKTMGDLQL